MSVRQNLGRDREAQRLERRQVLVQTLPDGRQVRLTVVAKAAPTKASPRIATPISNQEVSLIEPEKPQAMELGPTGLLK